MKLIQKENILHRLHDNGQRGLFNNRITYFNMGGKISFFREVIPKSVKLSVCMGRTSNSKIMYWFGRNINNNEK